MIGQEKAVEVWQPQQEKKEQEKTCSTELDQERQEKSYKGWGKVSKRWQASLA